MRISDWSSDVCSSDLYTRTPSEVSGALMTRYDETTPQLWKLPLRDEIVPRLSIVAPRGGYLVPAAHAAWVGGTLALHGIEFRKLDTALPAAKVEAFRADERDRKSTRLNSSHQCESRMPSSGGTKQ